MYLPAATTTASKSLDIDPSIRWNAESKKKGEAYFGPPSRPVGVTRGWLEGLEPESPTLLLPGMVDSLLDTLYAGVVSSCGVVVIAIDVEIGSIRSNVVANLIMWEF